MGSLRQRCKEFLDTESRNAILRQGSPVDNLLAFVVSEKGRSADKRLDDALPVCLYFGSDEDREEFMSLLKEAKPDLLMKKLP